MYSGQYNGKEYHASDLQAVFRRSYAAGVEKIIITAGSLSEARAALELARTDERLFCTVGVHPTRCTEFESYSQGPEAYLEALQHLAIEGSAEGKVVAIGECGLDYDRLQFCDKATQLKYFRAQFQLAGLTKLPMFLHLRAAAEDFLEVLQEQHSSMPAGVVHSFDGSAAELQSLLSFPSVYIGVNGCSLKTEENLAVAASIPDDRLMLETDCPWCEIRPSHASRAHVKTALPAKDKKKHDDECLVKGRNEPCNLVQVLEAVSGLRGVDAAKLSEIVWRTTCSVFFPSNTH
ncbi:Mg-dependent DNase [Coccomyxa subellipsoidea C-169]|uniref:Mg-dependent DNase n=1 Tax=Coccomyxa subellipsoidea (strain C-169) TaxID=574566 RepID=I0YLR1_COCSC|nr:Mg-dependent DNase [Coccomyxa subellipsoidea C-169]EIE19330.1 Mg-dependent DNase [Coccomyxa subellipsoidea C-169]|eukprot:XP_005643874.1 Mg-dependent DNase [Coccomyxa subellipsoidea C-169]